MKLFVLGATGGTGTEVVEAALRRGHTVTALVRSPTKLRQRDGLVVIKGDPRSLEELASALRGQDAVISVLGRRDKDDPTLLQDCARSTVQAMRAAGVRRLVIVSVALLFPDIGLLGSVLRRWILASTVADSGAMERLVAASELDWTIARPPRLLDGQPSGRFRAEDDRLPGRKITRTDLARFLLDEVEHPAHLRRVVGVAEAAAGRAAA
jgi:putative NADH-flavin reductase